MTGTTDRFIKLVEVQISAGTYAMAAIAQLAGVSPRTLQRRLEERGERFSALADRGRRTRALELIEGRGARFADIAAQLGYRDQSSFNRAFRRWTGLSPREYRARHFAAASPGVAWSPRAPTRRNPRPIR